MTHFLGNKADKIVHDLWNERPLCELWRLERNERAYFIPDTVAEARAQGFAICPHCIKAHEKDVSKCGES